MIVSVLVVNSDDSTAVHFELCHSMATTYEKIAYLKQQHWLLEITFTHTVVLFPLWLGLGYHLNKF